MPDHRPPENDGKGKSKFKIIDRRRIDPDDIEASDAPPEPEPVVADATPAREEIPEEETPSQDEQPAADDQPEAGDAKADADPLEFGNILISFLQTLVTVVWVHLGLVAHPQTQLVTKKLEEARKAIELYETLLKHSGEHLPPNVQAELERLLQDMKANYVNQL